MSGSSLSIDDTDLLTIPSKIDSNYYALHLLRRRKLDECIKFSAYHLDGSAEAFKEKEEINKREGLIESSDVDMDKIKKKSSDFILDEQLWFIQTKATVLKHWFDDVDVDEDGVGDILVEEEYAVVSSSYRPGTSLKKCTGDSLDGSSGPNIKNTARLNTGRNSRGRPLSSQSGFVRPGSSKQRPGAVAPPSTATKIFGGRSIRVASASLRADSTSSHINLHRINLQKYAREKPMIAKLLCDYAIYVENMPKIALELCTASLKEIQSPPPIITTTAAATSRLPPLSGKHSNFHKVISVPKNRPYVTWSQDWWWKARLGRVYYKLGLIRDAEKYFKAYLFSEMSPHSTSYHSYSTRGGIVNYSTTMLLELGKVYTRMDQPLTAVELYKQAVEVAPTDHHILLGMARLYDGLQQPEIAFQFYQRVLAIDSSNIESIACIAAYFFYEKNKPELSLRLYKRLYQMGVRTLEVWNNLGLCSYFMSQFDFALGCFDKALSIAKDDFQEADVWYNIGHVGIGLGDTALAYRAFRLAVETDPSHAEALNNLAVLKTISTNSKSSTDTTDINSRQLVAAESRALLSKAIAAAPELPEVLYNLALLSRNNGNLEDAFQKSSSALSCNPDHRESKVLKSILRESLTAI